ncbi:MAG: outer membrane lipoprotein carrier protein LolA [Planctomycetes bacterium]|nr:outer membrane lipoprotein carrier protein LolA [Planctomycetota bacterium]
MNGLLARRYVLISSALFAALCCAATKAGDEFQSPNADFHARLEAVDRLAASITDLTSRFVEQKHTALLKKPMVSKGRVRMKGSHTRWETDAPHRTTMLMDAKRVRIHYPRRKVVEVYPIDDQLRQLFVSPVPRWAPLRDRFFVEPIPAGDVPDEYQDRERFLAVRLTAKDDSLQRFVARVDVVLDTTTGCAARVDMIDGDGERTTITFSETTTNSGLGDRHFDFAAPEGTKVVYPRSPNARPYTDGVYGERQ